MKKLILLIGILGFYQAGFGQCDKTIVFKCYKGRELKDGSAEQELPVEAKISIHKGKVNFNITMNGETAAIEGEIKEVSICEWTDYLQNGKTRYKADMRKDNGSPENAIIEVESQNGYTKITCSSDPDTGSRLQLDVVEYTITEDESITPVHNEPVRNEKKKRKTKKH